MPIPQSAAALARPATTPSESAKKQQVSHAGLVRAKPGKPFFLVHYPRQSGNWAPLEIEKCEGVPAEDVGVWWLPVLQREYVLPGVGGHRTTKRLQDASAGWEKAHTRIARLGGTVLKSDDNLPPWDDRAGLQYVVPVDCIDPVTKRVGLLYIDAWSKPLEQLDGERVSFEVDAQRYRRWLLMITRAGLIKPMDPRVGTKHEERVAQHVTRRSTLLDLPAEQRKAYVAEAKAELDRIEGAKAVERAAA